MAKEVGNEPFEGTISSVFANLSLYREAVYAYIASIGVFFLIFSINAYDMVTNHWEVIEEAITEDSWSLNFYEEVEILEESSFLGAFFFIQNKIFQQIQIFLIEKVFLYSLSKFHRAQQSFFW